MIPNKISSETHSIFTKQNGGVTLLMSLVLVIMMGLIASYSSQSTVTEQRISSNHYRTKQAFEAAQAGLDAIINQLQVNFVEKLAQDGAVANNVTLVQAGFILPTLTKQGSHPQSVGSYSVEFNVNEKNPEIVDISVFGFAGDNETNFPNQTISQRLITTPLLSYKPPTPIIAKKSIRIGNDVSVINKTNSDIGTLPKAAWSGENIDIDLGGTKANIDVISNDGTLNGGTGLYENSLQLKNLTTDGFFNNFFSENKQKLKTRATVVDCSSDCTGDDLLNNNDQALSQLIWVETSNNTDTPGKLIINQAITLGNISKPVLLIVDGELQINNLNANLNGIIYTTRDFSNDLGNGNITGSLISEGSIIASGNLKFTYDDSQLLALKNNTSRYTRIAGSWKDF